MKKYTLILGVVFNADPLKNNFTTLIRTVEQVIESDNINDLEEMAWHYVDGGGCGYKILENGFHHEGVVWSNKAVNQYLEITRIQSVTKFNQN